MVYADYVVLLGDPVFEMPVFSEIIALNCFEGILPFIHFRCTSMYDDRDTGFT
jgi:hypothetical protein